MRLLLLILGSLIGSNGNPMEAVKITTYFSIFLYAGI